ncbi:Hpt domain-containing protein, partial [Lacipirellula limnantheis]|uniref:Hpt domain-containing protein n=1 Tax=Lacipirellula limnantheis TaxID=2528024 RepID=UPI001FE54309
MGVEYRSEIMSSDDQALLVEFVAESRDHLAHVEGQLLQIESNGANVDLEVVNELFRGIHSIKGAAGFLGLITVNKLAHSLENVLGLVRTRELVPTSLMVEAMLRASDALSQLVNDVDASNDVNVDAHIQSLDAIAAQGATVSEACVAPVLPEQPSACTPEVEISVIDDLKEESPAPVMATPTAAPPTAETSIRVQVGVLDSLMNLAGELVLGRNQLIQALNTEAHVGIE